MDLESLYPSKACVTTHLTSILAASPYKPRITSMSLSSTDAELSCVLLRACPKASIRSTS